MNKRIVSLILCFVMLMGVMLTGCSSNDKNGTQGGEVGGAVTDEASKSTITLSMYVVTEKDVSEKDQKLVQNAFNKITKARFKTQVILKFCTYDKYYETVESVIEANERKVVLAAEAERALRKAKQLAKADGIETDEAWFDQFYAEHPEYAEFRETEAVTGDETTAEETVYVTIEGADGYTISEIKYPDLQKDQIDIVWIDSYDRYMKFIDKEWLSSLDDEIGSASKKLKQYINNDVLTWAKWASSGTYAIPNNVVLGEYTYLLLNKAMIDKYNYTPENLSTLEKCSNYLKDVATYEKDILPIVGELPVTQTMYWGYDSENRCVNTTDFSILGNVYPLVRTFDPASKNNVPFTARNIFNTADYVKQLTAIQTYKDAGYVTENTDTDKPYALRVVKGGAELEKIYGEDYYINVLDYPRITEEDVFGNMFGVTTYTRSVSRSMEVITYLNTNAELRNVLQYGVENVHYVVNTTDEGKTITRLNNDYMMNIESTGNVFMAYPEEGMSADIWKYGKEQNKNAKTSFTMAFRVTDDDLGVTEEGGGTSEGGEGEGEAKKYLATDQLEEIRKLSEEFKKKLDAVKNLDELNAVIAEGVALTDKYSSVKTQTSNPTDESLGSESLNIIYYEWMKDRNLYEEAE